MKIFMLLDRCGLQEGSLYGPLLDLACRIAENNHEIHVLTRGSGSHIRPNKVNGVFIHRTSITSEKISQKFRLFFVQLINAIRLVQKFHFDVIYSHIEGYLGLINVITSRIFRRPSFHWVCTAFWYYEKKEVGFRKFLNWVVKIVLRAVDVIITCTNWMKEGLIREWEIPPDKIRQLPNGVDIDRFNPNVDGADIKEKLGIKNERIILFIHRLSHRKGPEYFIRAIPLVKDTISNIKCIMIGEGPQKSYLRNLTKKLDIINDVIFIGNVPNRTIPKYLTIADVLVVPSIIEEFGRIIIEGMACKRPIIATDVGGIPEIAPNDEVARLVPPKSHESIARAIIEIFSNKTLSDRLIEKGYKRVTGLYSQQVVAKNFIAILRNY
jgi:glycosyltransferase involved in cell wall biosynthesis